METGQNYQSKTLYPKKQRNKGFIVASILTAPWLVLGIAAMFSDLEQIGTTFLGVAVVVCFLFTFVSQLFWGGFISDVAFFGGAVIGTPGVIFELSLDGLVFLIGVKILFALIRLLVFLVTFLFFFVLAFLLSPLTFVPALLRMNREIKNDTPSMV